MGAVLEKDPGEAETPTREGTSGASWGAVQTEPQ